MAVLAIMALTALAAGRAGPAAAQGMVDPFHGASRMPGDLGSDRPKDSESATP